MGKPAAAHPYDYDIGRCSYSKPKSMDHFLEKLFEKRGSTRESALSSIVEGFTVNFQNRFAEKNFATLMHRCLNSIKRGSSKEMCLASHAIGLLAITIGSGDNAHELYEESLPILSQALNSKSETSKILDCLAIVTFIGGDNAEEIERSMQIIWRFINPVMSSNGISGKHSAAVLCAAISAWSFLLTTLDGWRLNYKNWQGAISYFSDKLEENDESVCLAASEALVLIFETASLEKFSSAEKADSSIHEGGTSLNEYSSIEVLKDKILTQLSNISVEGSVSSSVFGKACNGDYNGLKLFQDGHCPEISVKFGRHRLTLSTWSQSIQLNFLKLFLRGGFVKHMLENKLLHDVFEFTPIKKDQLANKQFISDDEEVSVHFYQPKVRKEACFERIYKSHNSVLNKAKTRLLNKQRTLSQRMDYGHYAVDDGSEAA